MGLSEQKNQITGAQKNLLNTPKMKRKKDIKNKKKR